MLLKKTKDIFFHTSQITCIATSLYGLISHDIKWPVFFFIYCACFFTYNFERVYQSSPEDSFNHPERLKFLNSHKKLIQCLCILSLLFCLLFSNALNSQQWLILIIAASPTFLYLSPRLLFTQKRLKEIYLAKEFSIALSWALITAVLPQSSFKPSYFFLCFALAFINVVCCDIHDSAGDKKHRIKTLANHYTNIGTIVTSACLLLIIVSFLSESYGFSLAFIHILISSRRQAPNYQYDLALIWPALYRLFQ
ncbi:hypothetical protein PQO03_15315 [Lentisphaera profundi]|uniref:Prenyltransferase n=1 Tax=Lentisphaera profundi TaxID=1658616 RepID=A0ABY7W152_9BACT|nr:hypothetical protein [Lentisphaera profundi]WDE99203.1 hypothetical protein PQO03_15315 [Lentisphaera profundi]